jgi:hypothetical protein
MFDFSSQPPVPTWRWFLRELKYYVAPAGLVAVGLVVVSALIFGSIWARLVALGALLVPVCVVIRPSLTRSRGLERSERIKILRRDVAEFGRARFWGWRPGAPRRELFSSSIDSPGSWRRRAEGEPEN